MTSQNTKGHIGMYEYRQRNGNIVYINKSRIYKEKNLTKQIVTLLTQAIASTTPVKTCFLNECTMILRWRRTKRNAFIEFSTPRL